MAKLIAIEWDANEARVIVGRSRGKELAIDDAFGVAVPRDAVAGDEASVGQALAAELRRRGHGKADALVGVGRASIELRKIQLPPAPDAELPDMVRFQAMRQFTTIGDDWPLDFVPLASTETAVEVLAATLSPRIVAQLKAVCAACDLSPKRLLLRPFSAASLLIRSNPEDRRVRLVLDLLASDADLFVIADGSVAFMRTVRIPSLDAGEAVRAAALLGETRRTIAAAQSQLGGRRIEAISVFGDADRHRDLLDHFQKQLELPIDCADPFALVDASFEWRAEPPENSGRFAPLLGMLIDEVRDGRHAIDFLSPRKRPVPKSARERYLAYTALAIAAGCLFAVLVKFQLDRKNRIIGELTAELKSLKTNVDAVKKRESHFKQVEQFAAGRIGWLDELRHLSVHIPDARNAIVTQFAGALQADGEGRIMIDGKVRTPDQVESLERGLRDERHRVSGRGASQDPAGKDYFWRFNETISIRPRTEGQTGSPSNGPPAPPPPPAPPGSGANRTLTAERPHGSQS